MKKFHEIHLVRDSPERLLAISSDFHLGQKFGVNFFSKGHSEMKIGAISEQFSEPVKLSGGGEIPIIPGGRGHKTISTKNLIFGRD